MRAISPNPRGRVRRPILLLVLLLTMPVSALAEVFQIADIRVEGLQRIAPGTVFNYLPVQVGDTVGDGVTGGIIRSLYRTGFFDDVRVERDGNVLVLWVRERPAIAEIEIVGNKDIETEALDSALADIGLKEGRVFNRSVLDRIEQELERQYFARGKYGVLVQSTVSPLERNRVAVRIEITEGLTARIKQINIIGNDAFSEKALRQQFELGPTRWSSFYSKNDQYSKQKLAGDLERLRAFYLDRGYIKFEIKSTQVSISADKKEIYVTVVIDEGEPYRISDIQLAGEPSVPTEKLFPLIELTRGDLFSRKHVTESAERISNLLGDEGYAFANVNTVPEIDEESHEVAVTFFVDPGKRVYVRRVNMKGNTRTRDEVLRREMRQLETAWFSADLVRKSRERLQRLGYFDDVSIETPPVPGSPDQVDVDVTVEEKPAGNLAAGIGFSQSQGILLNASVTQNNFLGTGKRVALAFNTSTANRRYQLAYTNPYYTVDGISRGFNLSYQETDYDELIGADYSTDVGVAGFSFGLPISDTSRAGLGLRYQYTDFSPGESELADEFVARNGHTFNDFVLSANYSSDSRDTALFPTRGALRTLRAEVALPGSDLEYYKLTYKEQIYIPLTSRFVFSLSGDLAYGDGYGEIDYLPFFENFYAGGPRSVRGWQANTLGPRELSTNDPVGGNLKLVGSIELFAPPPVGGEFEKTLRLGAFFDFGNVWLTDDSSLVDNTGFDLGDLRYSAGLSVSWLSPVGALSVSVAYPLNEKDGDETQVFQFGFGQTF
ncbi:MULTISPECIES: outer membrane protein assembly factor BamA [Marichromatium]|uniref:Outer membrane protein assembly factor BamA n=1 Tax=Marichromatium gracile TaxID=1048 RepID=A0A4R4A5S6_MARGR|nr:MULTISPECIES: outer membrane protein assembly factor BamA [Marichromatium]MBO8085268.1 outer membrane protein assembly factor BamA [Marichromatium sp.]RNE90276.1 outer membrane protein assembly factor BamA [Marichromatium sp. AB31]MBK1710506.1 outer membrane protein assembly factor BamA [Marichromatium gracile]RNE91114.1 outer membrane protein assembly factor BamA [Marichromatium sp. AB32]TCW34088.1 Beta-barrel assembly machine subunit BamA [Marichromatium gracile]